MKKYLIFAAVAAMFASCSNENDDYIASGQSQKITFSAPILSKNTRVDHTGAITGEKYPENGKFKVYAHRHTNEYASSWSNNFMDGVEVSMQTVPTDNKFWAPANDYYWPKNGDKVSFAAYSPSSVTNGASCTSVVYGQTGLVVTEFKLNDIKWSSAEADITTNGLEKQPDLMFAERALNKVTVDHPLGGSGNPYYGVDMKFHHALSLINFTVKSNVASNVTLKEITIKKAINKGNFSEGITDGAGYDLTAGSGNVKPKWTENTTVDKTGSTDGTFTAYQTSSGLEVPTMAQGVPETLTPANLLMIPQALKNDGDAQTITIKWTYVNGKGGGAEKTENDEITVNLYGLGDIKAWEIGKKYTYNIIIDLDKIYFNPTVENWGDGNGAGTDVKP